MGHFVASEVNSASNTPVSVNKPTGTGDTDLLIAACTSAKTLNTPSGWTQIFINPGTGSSTAMYYRSATGFGASQSFTHAGGTGQTWLISMICTYRGLIIPGTLEQISADALASGSLTTAGRRILVGLVMGFHTTNTTNPTDHGISGYAKRAQRRQLSGAGGNILLTMFDSQGQVAKGSQSFTATESGTAASLKGSGLVGLRVLQRGWGVKI